VSTKDAPLVTRLLPVRRREALERLEVALVVLGAVALELVAADAQRGRRRVAHPARHSHNISSRCDQHAPIAVSQAVRRQALAVIVDPRGFDRRGEVVGELAVRDSPSVALRDFCSAMDLLSRLRRPGLARRRSVSLRAG
jgi:hypothetical protein